MKIFTNFYRLWLTTLQTLVTLKPTLQIYWKFLKMSELSYVSDTMIVRCGHVRCKWKIGVIIHSIKQ